MNSRQHAGAEIWPCSGAEWSDGLCSLCPSCSSQCAPDRDPDPDTDPDAGREMRTTINRHLSSVIHHFQSVQGSGRGRQRRRLSSVPCSKVKSNVENGGAAGRGGGFDLSCHLPTLLSVTKSTGPLRIDVSERGRLKPRMHICSANARMKTLSTLSSCPVRRSKACRPEL